METIFDVLYLAIVLLLGIQMIQNCRNERIFFLFGIMGVVLGVGDAFHLIPRILALHKGDMELYEVSLGIGKMISSISTAFYYLMLYYVWRIRFHIMGKKTLTALIYTMLILRIILCLCPQNQWTSFHAPFIWAIYRNIPFVLMGLILIFIWYQSAKIAQDTAFQWMWLTVAISFACYIPVVLFSEHVPAVGMLMIPKACAYVWAMTMAYRAMLQKQVLDRYLNRHKIIR